MRTESSLSYLGGRGPSNGLSVRVQRPYNTAQTSGLIFVAHRRSSSDYLYSSSDYVEGLLCTDFASALQLMVLESDWPLSPVHGRDVGVGSRYPGVMYGCPPEVTSHVSYACVWDIRLSPPVRTRDWHDRAFSISAGDHFTVPVRASSAFLFAGQVTFLVLGFACKNSKPWQVIYLFKNFVLLYAGALLCCVMFSFVISCTNVFILEPMISPLSPRFTWLRTPTQHSQCALLIIICVCLATIYWFS